MGLLLPTFHSFIQKLFLNICYRLDPWAAVKKAGSFSLPHGIYIKLHRSTSNCPITQLQCAEWGDIHRARCPDLTYPGGSERKHAS